MKPAALALAALALGGCSIPAANSATSSGGSCHARASGTLPDPICTPGATNPTVAPQTISQTICRAGWTRTVRPPVSYTSALKRRQIRAYGWTDRNPRHYELDHLVSLELGGAPADPKNLWPEPHATSYRKDGIENALRRAVCSGRISLRDAQRRIATNWKTALS